MCNKAIVCDLDNTLIMTAQLLGEPNNWQYFRDNCDREDVTVNESVKNLICFYAIFGYEIIFLTARDECIAKKTNKHLLRIFNMDYPFWELYMRDEGDLREAHEMKKSKLIDLIDDYDIELFIDDEEQNCLMAKELGLTVLRVV